MKFQESVWMYMYTHNILSEDFSLFSIWSTQGFKLCDISNNREWWFLSTITVPYLQAFFRRAITDKNKYACLKENSCEITAQKRGNCSACRLQKCFDLGMSKSGQFHEAIVKI